MTLIGRGLRTVWADWGLRDLVPMPLKLRLRRGKTALRRARLSRRRLRGLPAHSRLLPAPPLRTDRRRMTLSHVLLASDLNPRYVEFWPLVREAWRDIAGIEPVLVLVARDEDVPAGLRDDGRVRIFTPLDGVHTAFQAQCIRLLYPALLDAAGAVLISDMELIPMSRGYWHEPLAALDATFFVSYRDVEHAKGMVAIPYNAAEPATWGEIFGIRAVDDVRGRLREWANGRAYDGARGGTGWFTDQLVLHDTLLSWGKRTGRFWSLDDDFTGFNRLNRGRLADGLSPDQRKTILAGRYTDFNAPAPYSEHRELIEHVVALARESLPDAPRPGPASKPAR